jgi:hypothetical protein
LDVVWTAIFPASDWARWSIGAGVVPVTPVTKSVGGKDRSDQRRLG